jgi:prevent-host-death family protein
MTSLNSVIPANEARANFYQILNEVQDKFNQFVITLRGKTQAVIISYEEFASWQETLEILSDRKLRKNIKKGLEEIKSGKGISQSRADKIIGW